MQKTKNLNKKEAAKEALTVITKRAASAPDRTIDFGWRIAIRAAIIKVSSPI